MSGIVMTDLTGDYAFKLVDDELWRQILEMRDSMANSGAPYSSGEFSDAVEKLLWSYDEESGEPKPKTGQILGSWNAQARVIEPVRMDGVVGILAL